jgi:ssDNA-binding replication factor A large subunit
MCGAMIGLTYDQLKDKIVQSSDMSESELNQKIETKMEQLSGLISKEGAAHIIANELGIKLFKAEGELKINDVAPGMKSVDVTGKIVRKYEVRTFNTNGREGKVASMILGDETGILRVALWNDQADAFADLKEGDTLKVKNALVRNNQGRIELHLNTNSKVEVNPTGVTIEAKERQEASRKKLNELRKRSKCRSSRNNCASL